MPLIKSGSKRALKKNIETEMNARPDNRDQALAIAYDVQRRNKRKKMAAGGIAKDQEPVNPRVNPKLRSEYEGDNNPGTPKRKSDDMRPSKEQYMGQRMADGGEVEDEKELHLDMEPIVMTTEPSKQKDSDDEADSKEKKYADGGMISNQKENYNKGLNDFSKGFNKGPDSPSEMWSNIKEGLGFGKEKDDERQMAYGGPAVRNDRNPGTPSRKPDDRRLNPDGYMSNDWAGGADSERKPDNMRPLEDEYMADDMEGYADGGEVEGYPENDDPNNSSVVEKILAKRRMMAAGGEVNDEQADVQENGEEGPATDISYNVDAKDHDIYDDEQLSEQPEDSNEHTVDLEDEDSHDRIAQIMKKLKSRA